MIGDLFVVKHNINLHSDVLDTPVREIYYNMISRNMQLILTFIYYTCCRISFGMRKTILYVFTRMCVSTWNYHFGWKCSIGDWI
jgi:hypothetical protein